MSDFSRIAFRISLAFLPGILAGVYPKILSGSISSGVSPGTSKTILPVTFQGFHQANLKIYPVIPLVNPLEISSGMPPRNHLGTCLRNTAGIPSRISQEMFRELPPAIVPGFYDDAFRNSPGALSLGFLQNFFRSSSKKSL